MPANASCGLSSDGPPLDADQHDLLVTTFGAPRSSKRVRRVLRRDPKLGRALRATQLTVSRRLEQAGLVGAERRWLTVLVRWLTAAVFVVALLSAVASGDGRSWLFATIALVLGVTVFAVMPADWRVLPASGFAVRDHLAGLRDYITLAEADRLRFLQSPNGALRHRIDTAEGRVEALVLNEKLLPYAVLFGQEREWAQLLQTEHRELVESGALDAVDALHLLGFVAEIGLSMPLNELFDGLNVAEVDVSLLGGIDLSGIELPAIGIDL